MYEFSEAVLMVGIVFFAFISYKCRSCSTVVTVGDIGERDLPKKFSDLAYDIRLPDDPEMVSDTVDRNKIINRLMVLYERTDDRV